MYTGPFTALGPGAGAVGALAYTGASTLFLALLGISLVIVGLGVLRMATLRRAARRGIR